VADGFQMGRTVAGVFARSLPVGPERNQKRQIAASLGALLKNDAWLNLYVKTVRTFRSAPLGVSRE
jgi:hypothetical protein